MSNAVIPVTVRPKNILTGLIYILIYILLTLIFTCVFLGLLVAMKMYEIHGPRHVYWVDSENSLFPVMNFGRIMSCTKFEKISDIFKIVCSDNEYQQILDFVAAVNKCFQIALIPGSFISDESMIKSFHWDLEGKIKIIKN